MLCSDIHVEESIKTLQYAAKARNIASVPIVHSNPGETTIAALEREIKILRTEISLLKARGPKNVERTHLEF